ncbi:hypothetical protein DL96DRAFT_1821866 [Flagelloscypha sp. PMI_526]|nr:hypothetical protein DL96DRAFT_1821866 [Flagelloscypha sp. PMI_526]
MALQDMAEEIVSEIITLVASDIISLKSFTLVNQRFGLSARRKLFSHFWLHIRSTSESGRRGAVHQENVDGTRFDFVAFGHANPELVGLSRRVRLPGQNLGYRDLRLPAALNLLVGIQDIHICGATQFGVDWKAVPESMRNTLLQVIFPRLRILRISTSIINLPLNFLNHAPLLSHLDLQRSVDLASNADVVTPLAPGIEPALRQLRLGIWYSPRTSTAQNALFTAIQARVSELICLTLDYPSRTIHKALSSPAWTVCKTTYHNSSARCTFAFFVPSPPRNNGNHHPESKIPGQRSQWG